MEGKYSKSIFLSLNKASCYYFTLNFNEYLCQKTFLSIFKIKKLFFCFCTFKGNIDFGYQDINADVRNGQGTFNLGLRTKEPIRILTQLSQNPLIFDLSRPLCHCSGTRVLVCVGFLPLYTRYGGKGYK